MPGSAVHSAARISSFPPLEPASARLLILGSMPGIASLRAHQYYGHPHNRFWPFMQALFAIPCDAPYDLRVKALLDQRVAVWDVLKHCERSGSLDSNIRRGSERPNAIFDFAKRHPELRAIALNGRLAEAAFRRHILIERESGFTSIDILPLPSTSPANASITNDRKLKAWSALLLYSGPVTPSG